MQLLFVHTKNKSNSHWSISVGQKKKDKVHTKTAFGLGLFSSKQQTYRHEQLSVQPLCLLVKKQEAK